jgi:endonuclease/exonuclease/phosphatase (EEP) superfamily protein YafD
LVKLIVYDILGNEVAVLVDEYKTKGIYEIVFDAGRPNSKSLNDQIAWGNYLVRKQEEEARFLISYLRKLDDPVIFGGDLNAPPNAKVMDKLYSSALKRSKSFENKKQINKKLENSLVCIARFK